MPRDENDEDEDSLMHTPSPGGSNARSLNSLSQGLHENVTAADHGDTQRHGPNRQGDEDLEHDVPEEIEDDLDVEPPSGPPPENCPWIVAGGALKLVIITVAMGAVNVPRRTLDDGTFFLMNFAPWISRLVAAYEAGALFHKHTHFVFEGFVNLDRKKNKVGVDKFRQQFRQALKLSAKENGGASALRLNDARCIGHRVIVDIKECNSPQETFPRKAGYLFKEFNRSYFGARLFNVSSAQANHWRMLYANLAGAPAPAR